MSHSCASLMQAPAASFSSLNTLMSWQAVNDTRTVEDQD
jgi:hypothetical protein